MSDHEKMTHERRVDQNALVHAARHLLSKQSIAAGVVLELGDGAIVAAGKQDAILMLLKPSPVAPEQDQAIAEAAWEYCPECGSYETAPPEEGCGFFCAGCGQEWHSDIDYSDVVRKHLADRFATPAAHIASKPNAGADLLTADEIDRFAKAYIGLGGIEDYRQFADDIATFVAARIERAATPAASAPTVPEGEGA